MEKLYSSKGISKKVLIISIVSMLLSLVIGISLFFMANAKVQEPKKSYYLNGQITQIGLERDKYDSETQNKLITIGGIVIIAAAGELGVLLLQLRSWTEIDNDMIKAYSMGKNIACKVSTITDVSMAMGGHVVVTCPTGKIKLITKDPVKAQEVIKDLIFQK